MSVAQDVNKQAVRAIANVGLIMGKGVAVVDPFLTINAARGVLLRAGNSCDIRAYRQ
jgi:hypothetical protein